MFKKINTALDAIFATPKTDHHLEGVSTGLPSNKVLVNFHSINVMEIYKRLQKIRSERM